MNNTYNTNPVGMNPTGFNPKVNPLDYPSVECTHCKNNVFVPGIIFYKVPGLELGAGSETVEVPVKVFVCSKCGELSPQDQDTIQRHNEVKNSINNTKSNLII